MPLGEGTLGEGVLGGSDLCEELMRDLPPFLQEDPDMHAVVCCYARERMRQEDYLERIRRQLFPSLADEMGLEWWETLYGLTVAPAGKTVGERRAIVEAHVRQLKASASGKSWEEKAQEIFDTLGVAAGAWSYLDHDPADADGPPPYVREITLPDQPTSDIADAARAYLRPITPAHLDLHFIYAGGFILGVSRLGEGRF